MTPDDAPTTTDDAPRLVHTTVPGSTDGLDASSTPAEGTEPDEPIAEESPDANERNPLSPRSDVSGDPLDLELGLPADDQPAGLRPLVPAAASLSVAEVTRRLRALGFRIRSTGERDQAIRAFKTGWFKLGPSLMDGSVANSILGPRASNAIDKAFQRGQDGLTTMSPHFSFSETRCKCGGHFTDCRRIWPTRGSVVAAEELRAAFYPGGLIPVSWCRCTGHNRNVGGVTSSRHLKGDAIDIRPVASVRQIRALDRFTGIGVQRSSGRVQHVDQRQGSSAAPVVWFYS